MILMRTWVGIVHHFPSRWPEWVMAGGALGMSAALTLQPDMFMRGSHYTVVGDWFTEATWASLMLWSGGMRVVALGINGTFRQFPYSPHFRAVTAGIGLMFWGMFALGFILSAIEYGTTMGPIVSYGIATTLEAFNVHRASGAVGRWYRERLRNVG